MTSAAANLIEAFASPELIERFAPKLNAWTWSGTMCLTEPQAGSAIGDVSTLAVGNGDGTYNVKGTKIFITGGDHVAHRRGSARRGRAENDFPLFAGPEGPNDGSSVRSALSLSE